MSTFQDRLRIAMAGPPKVSQAALARACGISAPSVNDWLSGKTKSIEGQNLLKAAEFLKVDPKWLATGRPSRTVYLVDDVARTELKLGETVRQWPVINNGNNRQADGNVAGQRIEVRTRSVPVVGKAMLGVDGFFEEFGYPVGHGEGVLNVVSRDDNAYGLRVVGHSMAPRIKHNEFVLIEPNHAYSAGDEVLVKTTKGQAMIKSFAYLRDGEYKFDSINAEYAPIILEESEVESIQFVGAIVKSSMFSTSD